MTDTKSGASAKSTTASKTSAKSEPKLDSVEKFWETMEANHAMMLDAFTSARARSIRVNDALIDNMTAAQTDMLELAKTVACAPRDYRGNFSATLTKMTDAQARALEMFKFFLGEQAASRDKTMEVAKKMYQSNKEALSVGTDMMKSLSEGNPISESWMKTLEAFKEISDSAKAAA